MSGADGLPPEARTRLLELARLAIASHLQGEDPALAAADDDPWPPRGAFVTLKTRSNGYLRGCIGHVEADQPLAVTVRRMAVAAATQDPRFPLVTPEELAALRLEISVLSPLAPIRPEEVEVGRHGLLVRFRGHSGLLLPQVPVAQRWDRETFLDHTCRKAGLPTDTWRDPACELLAFTAIVFGEE
ncbi:MAG TPA: AmmeMemoRadiSam system protein A [Vicinamibacteria bacterium]|nr:AmmeMemoRadiSam system protein A [Vicinamibacteria bacterium]